MYKVLSAPTAHKLEEEINKHTIESLGSLFIHNGTYFQAIIGVPKVTTPKKTTTKKTTTTKRKPKNANTTSTD